MATDLLSEYMTDAQLAVELDVCARTIERWRRRGEAPPSVKIGHRRLTRRSVASEWLRAREHDPAEAA